MRREGGNRRWGQETEHILLRDGVDDAGLSSVPAGERDWPDDYSPLWRYCGMSPFMLSGRGEMWDVPFSEQVNKVQCPPSLCVPVVAV